MVATRSLRLGPRLVSLQREAIVPAAALGVGVLLFAVSGRLGGGPVIPVYAPLVDMAIVVGLLVVATVAGMDVMVRRDGRSLPIVAIGVAVAAMGLPHMLSFPLTLLGQGGTAQRSSLVLDVVQIATPALLLVVFLHPATALADPRRALQRTGLEALGFGLLCAGAALVAAPLVPPLVDGLRYTSVHTALQFASIVPTIAAIVVFLLGHRADRRMELSLAAALILLSFGQLTSISDAALFDGRWYMSNLFRFLPVAALMAGQLTLYADVVKVERRRVQHLGLVHRITGELVGGNDLDALLGEVVVSAVDLVAGLRGVTGPRAVLVRVEAGVATPIAERDGVSTAVVQAAFRTSGSALLSAVLRGGRAAEAHLSDADSHHHDPLAGAQVAWIAYAPVRVRGGVVGALAVTTRRQPARDAEVLPLLQGIADLAGIAIRNAEDYRTVGDTTLDLLPGLPNRHEFDRELGKAQADEVSLLAIDVDDLQKINSDCSQVLQGMLREGGIRSVYQPIVDLGSGELHGFEALARPAGMAAHGSVESLFGAAVKLGMGADLDWSSRRAALQGGRELPDRATLFFNISVASLLDPLRGVDQTLLLLQSAGREPADTILEISERDLVSDKERFTKVLAEYRAAGLRFALDDVGEGHSTLEVLAASAPEYVKVAHSLVSSAATSASARAVIQSVVTFARATGALVIAEGLETADDVRAMVALGVELGQGYGLGGPEAPEVAALSVPEGGTKRATSESAWARWMEHEGLGGLTGVAPPPLGPPSPEARAKLIVDTAIDAVISMDGGGLVVDWNPQAEKTFGWRREEVVGRPVADVIIPEHLREAHREGLHRFLLSGEQHVLGRVMPGLTAVRRDGSELPVELAVSHPAQVDGQTIFVAFVRDMTERLRAESLERARFEVTQVLAEAASVGAGLEGVLATISRHLRWEIGEAWLLDGDSLVRGAAWSIDPARFRALLAGSAQVRLGRGEWLPGQVWDEGQPVGIRHLNVVDIGRQDLAAAAGMTSAVGFPVLRGHAVAGVLCFFGAEPLALDDQLLAIVGNIGRQIGAFLDHRDALAASDVLVRQLKERSAQLETAGRLKSDFLAAVSHELRTPVSVVIAYADLLRQPGSLAAVGTLSAIDEIATAGERLGRLIDDLLEYSHLQAGEVLSHLEPIELGALVGNVVGGLEMAATAKSLVLQLRAPQQEVVVRADPEQVRNVLLQLVSNALKFTDRGGVVVTVEDRGDEARVTVEDSGVGIAAGDLEVIFQQFRQAEEGRSRRFGGAGLGLSIARSLVEMQGGQLEVSSTPGKGTSFWFTLPTLQAP